MPSHVSCKSSSYAMELDTWCQHTVLHINSIIFFSYATRTDRNVTNVAVFQGMVTKLLGCQRHFSPCIQSRKHSNSFLKNTGKFYKCTSRYDDFK